MIQTTPQRSSTRDLTALQTEIFRHGRQASGPLTDLWPRLLDPRNLSAAWERVAANPGANSPGPDGQTCADIARRGSAWLDELADRLQRGVYRPQSPRYVDVPKHHGAAATRRLGILTVADRVVGAALKQTLEPLFEPLFAHRSFGFRPGRSVPAALVGALHVLQTQPVDRPWPCGVHVDVAACFDSLDHELLRDLLRQYLADPPLLGLLDWLLEVGGSTCRRWWRGRRVGLVQGSALSPLLCNLYLHAVDVRLGEAAGADPALAAFRYADDLLLVGRSARDVHRGLRIVRQELARLRLQLRRPVARPTPLRDGVSWLGVTLRERERSWDGRRAYGYEVPGEKVARLLETLTEMTQPPSERIQSDAFRLGRWIASLNEQLRQWREVYVYADNGPEVFAALDERARDRVRELLFQLTGQRGKRLWSTYRVWLPRGFWTWEADGVRLVCLSSLPPRSPTHLIRRPPWWRH